MSAGDPIGGLPVAVIGGGGHARVVIEALRCAGFAVIGVIDPDPAVAGRLPPDLAWLGASLSDIEPARCSVAIGVGSIDVADANPRPRLFAEAKAAGFSIARVVHPAAIVARGVEIGEGSQVMAGAILQPGVVLGANCIVNTGASLDHDCRLGDHVHVAPGAVLSGGVTLGDGCHIGTAAAVIQGVSVGARAMIAAGVVVTRDVPSGARLKRERT